VKKIRRSPLMSAFPSGPELKADKEMKNNYNELKSEL
jgi:hypothetical protein